MEQEEALRKLQETEFEMLKVFSGWCKEKNITWFIDSGTCLGAVRHSGFIPWDDDIDIGLPRKDYNLLLAEAKLDFPAGYSIHTSEDLGYTSLFAKMYKDGTEFCTDQTIQSGCEQCIYIDLFPYDYLPEDEELARKQRRTCANCQRLMYLYYLKDIDVPHSGLLGRLEKRICFLGHYLCRPFVRPAVIQRRFDAACGKYARNSSKVNNLAFAGSLDPFDESVLFPVSKLNFEGLEVPAPHVPTRYLRDMYGDWRRLPAPEERHTHLPRRIVFPDGSKWVFGR